MAWLSYIKVKQSKTQLLHFLSYRLNGQNKAHIANIQQKRRVEKKKKKKTKMQVLEGNSVEKKKIKLIFEWICIMNQL